MALAFMLSGQPYISLMDRVAHEHHHAHFANPLAGDVQFCGGDHDTCGLHHGAANNGSHHHSHGAVDHQHGAAAILFIVAQSFVLPGCPMVAVRCNIEPRTLAGVRPGGLDRPPK